MDWSVRYYMSMKTNLNSLFVIVIILMLAACGPAEAVSPSGEAPSQTALPLQAEESPGELLPIEPAVPAGESVPEGTTEEDAALPTNCASPEANALGASTAADYPTLATPEQVMGWFCDGAEFEDILTALETADQTGTLAEEMLQMLAAGMTWEEIWQVVGLTGQP